MKVNTIYCLEETKAPSGYLLPDNATNYFVVAKMEKEDEASEPAYPAWIETLDDKVVCQYWEEVGTEYVMQVYDPPITYALPETGGIGTTIFYILGALLVVGAGVLLITRRRVR